MVNSPPVQWSFKFMSSSSCHYLFFKVLRYECAFCSSFTAVFNGRDTVACTQSILSRIKIVHIFCQFFSWALYLFFLNFRSSSFILDFNPQSVYNMSPTFLIFLLTLSLVSLVEQKNLNFNVMISIDFFFLMFSFMGICLRNHSSPTV